MPHQDPIFLFIHFLSFLSQPFLFNYFLLRYLTPRDVKQAKKYGFFIFFIFAIFVTLVLYNLVLLRSIASIIVFQIICISLYQDHLYKKISAGLLMFLFNVLSEITSEFILLFFLGKDVFAIISYPVLITILVISMINIFIYINIFLHFFKNITFIENSYNKIFTVLTLFICLLTSILFYSFAFNGTFVMGTFQPTLLKLISILIIYIVGSVICTIYIYKSLHSLQQDIKNKILMQSIYNQYLSQLNDFINIKENSDNIKYLRHDIMNYLQTINTYQSKKE